jgi:hypothetical protein
MVIVRILHGALEIAIVVIALNIGERNVLSFQTTHVHKSTQQRKIRKRTMKMIKFSHKEFEITMLTSHFHEKDTNWYFDSRATSHVTGDVGKLTNIFKK